MKIRQAVLSAAVLAALATSGTAGADEAPAAAVDKTEPVSAADEGTAAPPAQAAEQETARPLRIDLSLYAWLSSVSSNMEARDREISSDVGFDDLLDALDFANFAHLEVQKGKWGLFAELDYVKLSSDGDFRTPGIGLPFKTEVDGVMKETMIELGAIRSFEGPRLSLDGLAGARYFRLESETNVGLFKSEISKDWVDPLVGARLRWRLSDRWHAWLRADLGGFGAGSDLTTNVTAVVAYDVSDRFAVGFGYRYMDVDYKTKAIEMSSETYGPVLGMAIRF